VKGIKKTAVVDKNTIRFCGNGLPGQPIPAGHFLVHNHVEPTSKLGVSGFRAWVQEGRDDLVQCRCDFGGCKNAELHKHYRVRSLMPVSVKKTAALKKYCCQAIARSATEKLFRF